MKEILWTGIVVETVSKIAGLPSLLFLLAYKYFPRKAYT